MRRFFTAFALVFSLAACGVGEDVRAPADPQLDALFERLAEAPDNASANQIEMQIWARWAESGSATVDVLLERARAAEMAGDTDLALQFLEQASDLAPNFAEPWNARARIAYAASDYRAAIAAISEALKREPRHFGAYGALGLIYEETNQESRALAAYRAALSVHPHYEIAVQGVRRLEPRVDGREA
jgi:tetratricopeptide (TPR) repeat protein